MSLIEIAAVDIESSCRVSLFVHCHRIFPACHPSLSTSTASPSLHVQMLDPPMLYDTNFAPCHKPRALDCSDVEYVAAVELAFSSQCDASRRRFNFRWCKRKRALTLMEEGSVAMKFCTIEFQVISENSATWRHLLHQVATRQREMEKSIFDTERSVQQMELLVGRKEVLLETALIAKQKVEDQFVRNFCALLNAKKDEIKRLQLELMTEKGMHSVNEKTFAGKRRISVLTKKATGAKLQRKRKAKEEEEEKASSDDSNESNFAATDDDDAEEENGVKTRLKANAIKAYSALPPTSRLSSVQISAGEDLLSSMDAIIDGEEEKSGHLLVRESGGDEALMLEFEAGNAPVQTVKPSKPTDDEAMDLSEEDIHDMLL